MIKLIAAKLLAFSISLLKFALTKQVQRDLNRTVALEAQQERNHDALETLYARISDTKRAQRAAANTLADSRNEYAATLEKLEALQ